MMVKAGMIKGIDGFKVLIVNSSHYGHEVHECPCRGCSRPQWRTSSVHIKLFGHQLRFTLDQKILIDNQNSRDTYSSNLQETDIHKPKPISGSSDGNTTAESIQQN